MRSAVIALLVFVAFSRSDFLLPFSLSEKFINFTAQLEKPTNNDTSCNLAQLNYCQYSFNQNFGLNSSVSYSNGTQIFETVQNYLNSNVTQLSKICRARTNFYHCLGHTYYTCMNLHTRLESNNTDSSNGFDYVRTFRGLEWICGGGYQETINQWNNFDDIPTSTPYRNCVNTFNQTVSTVHFCSSVQQTGDCLNTVYSNSTGDASAGHYGCENFRYTFAKACPGLKCTIGK
ncbi:hypothetical protein GCK72_013406 [Caenorhabditis remanei]|uniref:DUF19 domain-containing protein n=2 Tax=Caenorhabditis remanei TaxID=31234 RepID=A0A6A5GQK7_CAERE|nr:hypothetical protein GCK72_013406 [Caenorhabditis remanei]KAF1756951.1 hypothetical protein GCK72_013406 [Caenorhabditis remanei]